MMRVARSLAVFAWLTQCAPAALVTTPVDANVITGRLSMAPSPAANLVSTPTLAAAPGSVAR